MADNLTCLAARGLLLTIALREGIVMLKEFQRRADDLGERLLICELELHNARNLTQRMTAYCEFCNVVARMDLLRRDVEDTLHSDGMITRLDKKARCVACTESYKIAEWFATKEQSVSWVICPATFGTASELMPC
jgi:hypothetical protein